MYNEANPVREKSNDDYVLPRPLKRGDHVLIFDINKKGILASDPDENGFVFVQSGIMKTKVNISKLRLMEPERTAPQTQSKKISTKNVKSKLERKVQMELDIRGKNSDDGIYELGMFLDNAVLSGVGLVTVIHGKGTGILRSAVHKYLKGHPSVKSFRLGVYGEGEDGVTIVELK
jgi:DNA mismatch repair protein MutS2